VRFHAGENGTGKTTFIRMLAGLLKSDEQAAAEAEHDYETAHRFSVPQLNVSYKPQKISPKFQGTVRELLHKKIRDSYIHPQFVSDVMRPMSMDPIMENGVQTLSGGELQRVAIVLCLGTPADIYLVCPPCIVTDASRSRKYILFLNYLSRHARVLLYVHNPSPFALARFSIFRWTSLLRTWIRSSVSPPRR
jgi:ATP-binding cassette subfamily E protein 1